MSRTRKDSTSRRETVLEVVKNQDGTFDLFLNHNLDRPQVPEKCLPEWLCARFGFCGEEYESILQKVHSNGRATVIF
jgi:hypothetical protein